MTKFWFSHLCILGLLTLATGYFLVQSLNTNLPQLLHARQHVAEMQSVQGKIQKLILCGRIQVVSPNSTIQEEITCLRSMGRELDSEEFSRVQSLHKDFEKDCHKIIDQIEQDEREVDLFIRLDSAHRNSIYYVEQASRQLIKLAQECESDEFQLFVLQIRSDIASLWANKETSIEATGPIAASLSQLEKLASQAKSKAQVALLRAHVSKVGEVSPKITNSLERLNYSPLAETLHHVSRTLAANIGLESASVADSNSGFAVLIVTLIPFVICLLREYSKQATHLDQLNASLEERIKLEVARIQSVEEALFQARKLESIGVLAAGIAHEINTPMQCVCGNVEYLSLYRKKSSLIYESLIEQLHSENLIAREDRIQAANQLIKESKFDKINSSADSAIIEMSEACKRIIDIVRAMKSMTHPGTRSKVNLNINEVIRNATMISRGQWREFAVVELELDENLPEIIGFPGELGQVILNLVVNASDAIAEKKATGLGKILVRSSWENNGVKLEVSDTGCGIPDSIRRKVFDPFFTTKDVGKGTGQGLALTHDVIVSKHNGRISLESKVGEGTTFVLWIPYLTEDDGALCEDQANQQLSLNRSGIA